MVFRFLLSCSFDTYFPFLVTLFFCPLPSYWLWVIVYVFLCSSKSSLVIITNTDPHPTFLLLVSDLTFCKMTWHKERRKTLKFWHTQIIDKFFNLILPSLNFTHSFLYTQFMICHYTWYTRVVPGISQSIHTPSSRSRRDYTHGDQCPPSNLILIYFNLHVKELVWS